MAADLVTARDHKRLSRLGERARSRTPRNLWAAEVGMAQLGRTWPCSGRLAGAKDVLDAIAALDPDAVPQPLLIRGGLADRPDQLYPLPSAHAKPACGLDGPGDHGDLPAGEGYGG